MENEDGFSPRPWNPCRFDSSPRSFSLFHLILTERYTEHQPNPEQNEKTELDQSTRVWHFSTLC